MPCLISNASLGLSDPDTEILTNLQNWKVPSSISTHAVKIVFFAETFFGIFKKESDFCIEINTIVKILRNFLKISRTKSTTKVGQNTPTQYPKNEKKETQIKIEKTRRQPTKTPHQMNTKTLAVVIFNLYYY